MNKPLDDEDIMVCPVCRGLIKSKYNHQECFREMQALLEEYAFGFLGNWNKALDIGFTADTDGTGEYKETNADEYQPFIKTFTEYAPPGLFNNILDLGCGNKIETGFLSEYYPSVHAVHYDPEYPVGWLRTRRQESGRDWWISEWNADMHRLSEHLADEHEKLGKIDAVFALQTLEHAFAPWIVILEMRKILRDGGRVYLDLPDPDDQAMLETIQHTSVLYTQQWIALFVKAGFRLVANLSVKHRLGLVFEKLPDVSFPTWPAIRSYYLE